MAYKQRTVLPVEEGGTGASSFTAYAVVCAGTTDTGAFQSVSGTGTSGQVLTCNGTSALPSWQAAPADNQNVIYQTVSSDPGSPSNGDVWFNSPVQDFKGYQNGSTIVFNVTPA